MMRPTTWASPWPNSIGQEDGQGAVPRGVYNTTMEMMDQRRLTMIRQARARRLRVTLTNPRPILPNAEAYGYHGYGGDFGQNSHFDPISPTYSPRWTHHEDLTYGGYQPPHYPQHYPDRSQDREPSWAEFADLGNTSANHWVKAEQEYEEFRKEVKGLMSTWGKTQDIYVQPKYLHQGLDLGKEAALTELVNTMGREKAKLQQEMERFTTETRDTIQAMSTEIAHLTQLLRGSVKKNEELPAQVYVQPIDQSNMLPKEVTMSDADETLLKDTDEAYEGKEDKIDDHLAKEEAEMPKTRIQPPFPRRVARNMEAKEMSELLKVFKNEDKGMFLVPCDIGNAKVGSVVLNMEDSDNIMPATMYHKLKLEPLKPTNAMIRLADMSRCYPVGIAEGVLVKVKDLILRTDFYVLNMRNSQTRLGRPFLEAARDQIDCDARKPSCELHGETLTNDLIKAEEQPPCMEIVEFEDNTKQMVEEILPQNPLEQETTDWTLANNKSISPSEGQQYIPLEEANPARAPQRNLDLTKKLLALVIMRLTSSCPRESPMRVVPKKSDEKVVKKEWKELLPMKSHGDWGVPKVHQNFVWEPGGQDARIDEQVQ